MVKNVLQTEFFNQLSQQFKVKLLIQNLTAVISHLDANKCLNCCVVRD